jgi:hypothetical protein
MTRRSTSLGLALSLLGLLATHCKKVESKTSQPLPAYQGLFVLNEGQWTLSNASIDQIEPEYQSDLFQAVNGERLGDVANFWVREQDTLWIVLNGDRLLRKILLPSFQQIGSLSFPLGSSPREFLRLSPDKAYVNSLLDAKIYRFNPATLTLLSPPILVENYMESLLYAQGRVWVSCGNYAYPARNHKLACIDPVRDTVLFYVNLPVENPGPLLELPNGDILVGCRGNYADQKGLLAHIDPQTGHILRTVPLSTSIFQLALYNDAVYMLTDSGVTKYDPTTGTVDYTFLSRGRLGLPEHHLIYGFMYDNVSQRWLIANARSGGMQGEILWVRPDKTIEKRQDVGVFPAKFLRYP